jgi:hypothetical protein
MCIFLHPFIARTTRDCAKYTIKEGGVETSMQGHMDAVLILQEKGSDIRDG